LVCTLKQKPLSLQKKITAMPTPRINTPAPRPMTGEKHPDAMRQVPHREDLRPMTLEEFRAGIMRSIEDYRAGRTISQEDLEKEILTWR
jgi:hypothetical protein